MAIAGSVLRKFVELTKEPDISTGYYVYGTAIVNSDGKYVRVDGSDSLTSVSIATDIVTNDRVLVYIEGHKASVIGNVTCPASGRTAVDVSDMLEDFSSLVVGALYATYAEIESIRANYVTTEYLEATYATITDLKVVFEDVDILYAGVANIETLLGGEGGFGELQSIHLSAGNAVIDQAVIVNAVAGTVMADLILSDFINTDIIKIGSTDGTLWIDGSTILIIDTNDNPRIQIGLDNIGDYNLALWDEDGNCMWNAAGVTEYGVNDGVIRDEMVAADAAIKGSKLDIESICSIINENGDYVISAGSVKIDDQSLDAWYTQITQQVEGLEGLSTENLRYLEPWFCLWNSDTEAPPDDVEGADIERVIDVSFTLAAHEAKYFEIDVSYWGYRPLMVVSSNFTNGAVEVGSAPILGPNSTVTFILENPWDDTAEGTLSIGVAYIGLAGLWVDYDIPVTEGMYKWVKWLGTYNDGHTEWSTPYCLTDGYLRTTTSVLQTELTVVQGQIEAYVWETETALNGLEESIKDTWAVIEISIGEILQTVGDMETTLYGADGSVGLTTQVSLIEQTANSISESVNSVVSWLGDGYSSSLSLDTCITQYVDEASSNILLEVRSSYATTGEAVKSIVNYYALGTSPEELWQEETFKETYTIPAGSLVYPEFDVPSDATVTDWSVDNKNVTVSEEPHVNEKYNIVEATIQNRTSESQTVTLTVVVLCGGAGWSPDYPTVPDGYYLWVCQYITYADGHTELTEPFCVTDDIDLSGFATIVETNALIEASAKETEASILSTVSGNYVSAEDHRETTATIYEYINDTRSEIIIEANNAYESAKEYTDAQIKVVATETESSILSQVSYAYSAKDETVKAIQNYYCLSDNYWSPGGFYIHEDFSSGSLPSGWSRNNSSYVTFGSSDVLGTYARMCASSGSATLYANSIVGTLSAGKYVLRFKAATEAGYESTAEVQVRFPSSGSSYARTFSDLKSNEWTQFELEYELTSDTTSRLYFYNTITNVPLLITDVIFYGDDGSWSTTLPTVPDGYYLWVRQFITYADGTTEWIEPFCVTDDLSNYPTLNVMTASIEQYVDASMAQITISTSGGLGKTAEIILTTGGTQHITYLDMEGVRQAFADDETSIVIEAGTIAFMSGTLLIASNQFGLDEAGNATFSGTLSAPSGEIGGFTIANSALYTNAKSTFGSTRDGVYVGTDGISLGSGFSVDDSGHLISTSGEIGGFTIANSALYTNAKSTFESTRSGVYVGTDGISLGSKFSVDTEGYLTATSGKIGGWFIGTSSLYNGTNSMQSTTVGTYIGTDGIRQYSGGNYLNITAATLENGDSSNNKAELTTGIIQFYHTGTLMGHYGTNYYNDEPSKYGMVIDSEYAASYIGFARKKTTNASLYTFDYVINYGLSTSILGRSEKHIFWGDVGLEDSLYSNGKVAISNSYGSVSLFASSTSRGLYDETLGLFLISYNYSSGRIQISNGLYQTVNVLGTFMVNGYEGATQKWVQDQGYLTSAEFKSGDLGNYLSYDSSKKKTELTPNSGQSGTGFVEPYVEIINDSQMTKDWSKVPFSTVYSNGFIGNNLGIDASSLWNRDGDATMAIWFYGAVLIKDGVLDFDNADFMYRSDRTLKKNIKTLDGSVLDEIEPVSFNWKEGKGDDKKHYGYIANDVKEVLPEIVSDREDGEMSMNYMAILPLLHAKVRTLENRITELERGN